MTSRGGPPWLPERVLHDGDLLVVDKPPGIVVHGGDAERSDDVVGRLRQWLVARGDDDYLGVHQRLDKDASGVLAFTRKREINAAVAKDFERHDVGRTYVALVRDAGLADAGRLEHRLAAVKGGATRVVRQGGQLALASFRVLQRVADRALVELRPETGRTHQLRVQLAAAGSPIAGDRLYGGPPAPRLMLHARRLALPSVGLEFEAEVPEVFSDWLNQRVTLGSQARVRSALLDAACFRYSLPAVTTAHRWVNDIADDMPGVTIDRYREWVVLFLTSDEALARETELAELCVELGASGVYVKRRPRGDLRRMAANEVAPVEPIAGSPAPTPLTVSERDLSFVVELGDGLSTGLFLDQRDGRALIRGLCVGANVLNLFSYTGSFSVAAAAGGAARVTSIDLSGRALARAKQNFAHNGLEPTRHRFVQADVFEWLARAARRDERFDLIVLDPPSFGTRGKRSTFNVGRDYGRLAAAALGLLAPGGRLLAVTNHRKTSRQRLRRLLRDAARTSGVHVAQIKDLPSPLDFPDGPEGPLPSKSVVLTAR